MKPSRLSTVLESLLGQRWPAFIWGPPGVGKSSIVRQIAADRDLPVVDLRASLLDPTDLRGIPAIEGGRAVVTVAERQGNGAGRRGGRTLHHDLVLRM